MSSTVTSRRQAPKLDIQVLVSFLLGIRAGGDVTVLKVRRGGIDNRRTMIDDQGGRCEAVSIEHFHFEDANGELEVERTENCHIGLCRYGNC
jgi:hypothetical protein